MEFLTISVDMAAHEGKLGLTDTGIGSWAVLRLGLAEEDRVFDDNVSSLSLFASVIDG